MASCGIARQHIWYVSSLILVLSIPVVGNKPNIIIMLADDLGYGDVGCFGNTTLSTPNIDTLVKEGVQLTHHLAASSLCAPSRAALLTGRYASRSGMVANGRLRVNIFVANKCGMSPNEITIAEVAKEMGYKTALIGKWHLGLSQHKYGDHNYHPLNQGFDYYYGHILTNMKDLGGEGDRILLSQQKNIYWTLSSIGLIGIITLIWLHKKEYISKVFLFLVVISYIVPTGSFILVFNNLRILNGILMRNHDVVEQPLRLNSLMTRYVQEGIEFLEQREKDQSPFLLMLSWDHVHTALKVAKRFERSSDHGRYGDAVKELDWGTGEIMSAVKKMTIGKNTLVYSTSDNGGHLEESGIHGEVDGGYNGIFKGGKAHGAVDGGIRVPSAVWFPGKLPSNKVIDEPTTQMDMFTTFVKQMGTKIPQDRVIDGKDLFPLFMGKKKLAPQEFLFHYCGDVVHAIRYRPKSGNSVWKLVLATPDYLPGQNRCTFVCSCDAAITLNPPHLHDMTSDPGERRPINFENDKTHTEIVSKMMEALEHHKASVGSIEPRINWNSLFWRPHMQPCCNFPYCDCEDPKYSSLD